MRTVCHGKFGVALATGLVAALAAGTASADVWGSIYNKQWKGVLEGKGDGNVGSYAYGVTVYKMDDGDFATGDFYRIDQYVETAIKDYRQGKSVCGWSSEKVIIGFALKTKKGSILEYEPQTFQGAASYSQSVELSQGVGTPSVKAGYSMSTTVPDAGIKAKRDITGETIRWEASLRGCKSAGASVVATAKIFEGASKLSKSSYRLDTTVLVKVPEGARLLFENRVKGKPTKIVIEKKKYRAGKGKVFTQPSGREFSRAFRCSQTSCS